MDCQVLKGGIQTLTVFGQNLIAIRLTPSRQNVSKSDFLSLTLCPIQIFFFTYEIICINLEAIFLLLEFQFFKKDYKMMPTV